ncbi:MAG: Uma2 family endonuclease [Deltaproteobacteria bacterium]|nr:Uma2 family endonuclease [Deltaproteobacteria bacterium]
MRAPSPRVPTFEELYKAIVALPEGVTGEILEPGVIRTMARPGRMHRLVAKSLSNELARFDRDRGGAGWWLEVEAEVRFPNERLAVPDLAGWRAVDESAAFLDQNPIVRVPDWCCEVLSPTTERDDRRLKLPLYADQGVTWTWLVDPEARIVEVHESRDRVAVPVTEAKGDSVAELPPFGPFDLRRLWEPAR